MWRALRWRPWTADRLSEPGGGFRRWFGKVPGWAAVPAAHVASANLAVLLWQCQAVAESVPAPAETTGHMAAPASRWNRSGPSAGGERETCAVATRKTTAKNAYSSSHPPTDKAVPQAVGAELVLAIRQHWGVESNSWICDVRFD